MTTFAIVFMAFFWLLIIGFSAYSMISLVKGNKK